MAWQWKWRQPSILVWGAEGFERTEIPVYRSTGGPIFKTLLSSGCRMDCRCCPFAYFCRIRRTAWRPDRLVRVFLQAHREGLVRGLFLSSALYGDPEKVSSDIIEVAERLRAAGYRGYIHLRLMPGTPPSLVKRALELANRVGINLEAPSPSAFQEIAPSKGSWSLDIYSKLLYAARIARDPRRIDTQLVLGASDETDEEVLRLVETLVAQGVGVVHFSPYTPVPGTPLAEKRRATPLWRVHQLYEALILIRDYSYALRDLEPAFTEQGYLPPLRTSLKEYLAQLHPEWFPVDPLTAKPSELTRVPGIGPSTAKSIVGMRTRGDLSLSSLRRLLGPRWRKAQKYLDLSRIKPS